VRKWYGYINLGLITFLGIALFNDAAHAPAAAWLIWLAWIAITLNHLRKHPTP
jgi:hypothetical protein